jgi:hypothetical protein
MPVGERFQMPYYPDGPQESNPGTPLGEEEADKTPVSVSDDPCLHVFEEYGEGELVCVLCGLLDREWTAPD